MFVGEVAMFVGEVAMFVGEVAMFVGEVAMFVGEVAMFASKIGIFLEKGGGLGCKDALFERGQANYGREDAFSRIKKVFLSVKRKTLGRWRFCATLS